MVLKDSNTLTLSGKSLSLSCIGKSSVKRLSSPSQNDLEEQFNILQYFAMAVVVKGKKTRFLWGGSFLDKKTIYVPQKCKSKIKENNDCEIIKHNRPEILTLRTDKIIDYGNDPDLNQDIFQLKVSKVKSKFSAIKICDDRRTTLFYSKINKTFLNLNQIQFVCYQYAQNFFHHF